MASKNIDNGFSEDFDLDIDLDVDIDLNIDDDKFDNTGADFPSRYHEPAKMKFVRSNFVRFKYADEFAEAISPFPKDSRVFGIVNGSFVFGEFIGAFIVKNKLKIEEMTITTLSLSEMNIDMLSELLKRGYIQKLNIIISDYFYGHEKSGLIKRMYKKLDIDNRFQLSIAANHTKITQFKTTDNQFFVFYGSANLRSSQSIEQVTIEESEKLYNYNKLWMDILIDRYQTIKKPIQANKAWKEIKNDFR